jgi:mannose-1-phosphate guanylyltransferase
MRALLLAAGIGSRLRPLTDTIPKCMVTIHGRPLLDYWLELLFAADIERVLINTHWLAPKVQEFVQSSRWKERIDLVHEEVLLGTGGTLWKNRDYFGGAGFLLAHADNLTDFDVAAMRRAHETRPAHCVMTMLAFRTDDPRSCGILELDDKNVVQAFHEKVENPPGNLANGAVYMFTPDILKRLSVFEKPFIDLSVDVIPQLLGLILAFETTGYHRDIGNQESLRRAEIEFNPKT